jgi:hypothetical protein
MPTLRLDGTCKVGIAHRITVGWNLQGGHCPQNSTAFSNLELLGYTLLPLLRQMLKHTLIPNIIRNSLHPLAPRKHTK